MNPRSPFRLALVLPLFMLAFASGWAAEETAAATPDDPSSVKPADCPRCGNSGAAVCPACKGKGTSFQAKITCPKCSGKGKVTCDKCDGKGKIPCPDCKKRTLDGKEVFAAISQEWKDWDKKYHLIPRDQRHRVKIDKEPEKYVPCPTCEASGQIACPECTEGQAVCKRCGGAGTVTGQGPCNVCDGTGQTPCPQCATLEGIEDTETYKALVGLREQKLLKPKEFFGRLRVLVAQEKFRREAEERRAALAAKKPAPEADKPQTQAKPETAAPAGPDWSKPQEAQKALLTAFAAKALTPKLYDEKLRTLGLPEEMAEAAEVQAGRENPRLKALADLKQAFRRGDLDLHQYQQAYDGL